MSMELSTFKTFFGWNKTNHQHWMFALFLTAELSALDVS